MPHAELCISTVSAWQPAVQQQVFRCLMHAFAYPGRVLPLPHRHAGEPALIRVLATLLDGEVGLADLDALIPEDARSRLEARTMAPEFAPFIIARAERTPDFLPSLGSLENPEHGATLILKVRALGVGASLRLTGPGICGQAEFAVQGLDPAWLAARAEWNVAFPTGVDLLLVDEAQIVALPRTTHIQTQGEN